MSLREHPARAGRADESIAQFNLGLFRKRAWAIAESLYILDDNAQLLYIDGLYKQIKAENIFFTSMGTVLLSPFIKIMAKRQNQRTADVIMALNVI